jgi:hypothetical protein
MSRGTASGRGRRSRLVTVVRDAGCRESRAVRDGLPGWLERNQGRRCGGSEAVEGITPCGARELDWRFPGIEVGWILGIAPTAI